MTFPLNYGLSKTGLPLIVVKLFGNDICLMLDTGSNRNIIDHRIYDYFKEKLKQPETSSEVYTLNGVSSGITTNIPFSFEEHDYLEPFLCSEIADTFDKINEESGIQIHGILGNKFFIKNGWVLDFDKLELSW
ncbi:MAG: hypothetical protein FWF42_03865 [Streptococcaceae bacterium]|nr:hypothetical protein [Streptococcaceae bacterium]